MPSIRFYKSHFGEMFILGLTATWGEYKILRMGIDLIRWEFGIIISWPW